MKETNCGHLEVMVRFGGKITNLKEVLLKIEDEQATVKEVLIPLKSEEQDVFKGQNLADAVEIGDYVNYPVEYENVEVLGNKSSLKGWRVISKNIDLDGNYSKGIVNLVSAGVPLTFWHYLPKATTSKSIKALTTDFLLTEFVQVGPSKLGYVKNGFNSIKLSEVFNNRYTMIVNDKQAVRAMKKSDFDMLCDITKDKHEDLFFIKDEQGYDFVSYWLASACRSNYMWSVSLGGYLEISGNSEEGIRPVVSLSSEVLANGKDETGAWNIRV